MYLGEGVTGVPAARFFRTDDAAASVPVFTDLTTTQNINYCTGQCWYDNVVYSPPGRPDVVYLVVRLTTTTMPLPTTVVRSYIRRTAA